MIGNCNIYVDAYMRWDDLRVIKVKQNFYDFTKMTSEPYTDADIKLKEKHTFKILFDKNTSNFIEMYKITGNDLLI